MLEIKVHPNVTYLRGLEMRRREKCVFLANVLMLAHVSMINYQAWISGELHPNESALKRIKNALYELEEAMGL